MVDLGSLVIGLVTGIGAIIAAIGAWRGNNKARMALLVFVTIHYALVGLNNAQFLLSGEFVASEATLLGRVLRGVLYPAGYVWYFTRPNTLRFYR